MFSFLHLASRFYFFDVLPSLSDKVDFSKKLIIKQLSIFCLSLDST